MSDRRDEEMLIGYVRGYTKPVQWLGWWRNTAGTPASDRLGAVLFEPDGATLRDLSAPSVREDVVRVVLESDALRRAVVLEVEHLLDSVYKQSAREKESDT